MTTHEQRDPIADLDAIASQLDQIDGLVVERNVSAGPLCTYRVGGPISVLARVESRAALIDLGRTLGHMSASGASVATLPIGKGSNLLVADGGFAGVGVVLSGEFTNITVEDDVLTAGAAAMLPLVARASVRHGLTGFEWAVGVPGTIGGGVRMNAGGHGSDLAANLVSVEIIDLSSGELITRDAAALELGYRTSNISPRHLVIAATLKLETLEARKELVDEFAAEPDRDPAVGNASVGNASVGSASVGDDALSEIVRWRRANQPGGQNAGSVFTNPPNDSAGRLIDAAGMKGERIGSAEVSTVHANFIQVDPNGSANDVMALMREIVATVESASGIRLHAETRLVGFPAVDVAFVQQGSNLKKDGSP